MEVATVAGYDPATSDVTDQCSSQLSYTAIDT